ncbi:hypothetical protein chiPu_0023564, partial [Chiloscyllium punctatum]|nr:hypothetical protein [Chiloscyllium punctatum]
MAAAGWCPEELRYPGSCTGKDQAPFQAYRP